MTKYYAWNEINGILKDVYASKKTEEEKAFIAQLIDKVSHEMEMVLRKNQPSLRKPTKAQLENEELANTTYTVILCMDLPATVSAIAENVGAKVGKTITTQKLVPILNILQKECKIQRIEEKRKPLYQLA